MHCKFLCTQNKQCNKYSASIFATQSIFFILSNNRLYYMNSFCYFKLVDAQAVGTSALDKQRRLHRVVPLNGIKKSLLISA